MPSNSRGHVQQASLRCAGLEQREDRVKVGILFNPLIWLKPKPHWFEQETRDTQEDLLGAGQGGVEC